MPLYEFRCPSCGAEMELTLRLGHDETPVCPECCEPTKRVFSPPALGFSGPGFYATDNGKAAKGE